VTEKKTVRLKIPLPEDEKVPAPDFSRRARETTTKKKLSPLEALQNARPSRPKKKEKSVPLPEIQADEEIPEEVAISTPHIRHFGYVRVLGLALVLAYHFYPNLLPGGFIGVDVFFVFSGYLITALALEEYRRHQSFNLKKFAERRFFRIFPTVAFAMLLILPLTLFGTADVRYQLRQQIFAGLGFITNFYESSTGQAYDTAFAPHIWVHLWSLALEVQFYLVWGLLIWLIVRQFKKASKGFSFFLASLLFLASAIAMFVGAFSTKNVSSLYYSPIFHIFPFFLGAAMAALAGVSSNKFIRRMANRLTLSRIRISAGISALLLIILAFILHFDWLGTYLVGFFFAALFALALIFFLRLLHEKTENEEPRVIKFFADISYGIYIFHWPLLLVFVNLRLSHGLSVILTFVLATGLSALMYYGIDPILRGKRKIAFSQKLLFAGVVLLSLIPSGMAIANSSDSTVLSQQLISGGYTQTSQQLYLSEKFVETGTLGKNILVIGDSVTVGVTTDKQGYDNIANVIPAAVTDAQGDKKISSDLKPDLDGYLPLLPKNCAIVIALGTNSISAKTDISILQSIIQKYASSHPIVLVTPGDISPDNVNDSYSNQIADWELSIKGNYKNVAIADWRGALQGHPEYVDSDGIHLSDRPQGREVWLNTLSEALKSLGVKLS
jgi:peptidoglycan/LPS O-acetylase OafA/YrhL